MHHILRGPTSPSGIAMTSSPSFDPTARSPSSTVSNGRLPTSMMSPRTRGLLWLRLEALERLGAVRRLAADCTFALVRRFVAVRRLAVVCGFAAVRRFNGARFFRDKCDVAARFLRFAIGCFLSEINILSKKTCSQRGERPQTYFHAIYGGTRRTRLALNPQSTKGCRKRREVATVKVEGTMPETRKVEIRKQIRLFDDFFKVDEILVAHEQRDGTM